MHYHDTGDETYLNGWWVWVDHHSDKETKASVLNQQVYYCTVSAYM